MARHHEPHTSDDATHGIGDTAGRNARSDCHEQFGTGGRTQNPPDDFGTERSPQPFDRGYREQPQRHDSRFDESRRRAGGFRGLGPKNYMRSDERICEDLNERLWYADDVDASEVSVEVHDAVVTLRGSVEQRWLRHRIEDIADDCGGVQDIRNEIRVQRRNHRRDDERVAPEANADNANRAGTAGGDDEGMLQSAVEHMPARDHGR